MLPQEICVCLCFLEPLEGADALQEAGSAQVREALERLTQQNETLRAQLLEAESALLAEQEAVADLKQALAAPECRHATPLKADQAVQVRRDSHCMGPKRAASQFSNASPTTGAGVYDGDKSP